MSTVRRSSYSRFLPAVLRETGAQPEAFSVDSILLVAEKILSGIDDDAPPVHDGIETVLDRLPLLFDPDRTPESFLPVLASWLGADAMRSWKDHRQLRRAVAGTAPALGLRGLHEGLRRLLDPFEIGATRPRITLDDGSRILFATPTPGRVVPVHTLVAHGPFLRRIPDEDDEDGPGEVVAAYPGLVDPGCIAATPDGDLLVGDDGLPGAGPAVRDAIWRISRTGAHIGPSGPSLRPRPLGPADPDDQVLDHPRALAVDGRAGSWQAYVLDRRALYRLATPQLTVLGELATRDALGIAASSEAMVLDGPGRLLVIDRGRVVGIDANATPPTAAVRHQFGAGIVPGPLAVLGTHLVVADLRSQEEPAEGPGDTRPADLVLLDRSDPARWTEHRLLDSLPESANPLVTPVALAADGPNALLVLDLGLRPVTSESADPSLKVMAEPAAVFRVRLEHRDDGSRPVAVGIERVTAPGRLTLPNGMAVVDGTVYISDPGQPAGEDDNPLVRNMPGHVAVQVHFSRQRPADVSTRRTIAHDVTSIVNRHNPASVVAARPLVPTEPE